MCYMKAAEPGISHTTPWEAEEPGLHVPWIKAAEPGNVGHMEAEEPGQQMCYVKAAEPGISHRTPWEAEEPGHHVYNGRRLLSLEMRDITWRLKSLDIIPHGG